MVVLVCVSLDLFGKRLEEPLSDMEVSMVQSKDYIQKAGGGHESEVGSDDSGDLEEDHRVGF